MLPISSLKPWKPLTYLLSPDLPILDITYKWNHKQVAFCVSFIVCSQGLFIYNNETVIYFFYSWIFLFYVHNSFLIHSSFNGHRSYQLYGYYELCCHEHVYRSFVWTLCFNFLGHIPRTGITDHILTPCLTFKDINKLFSKAAAPLNSLISNTRRSSFSISSSTIGTIFLTTAIPVSVKWYLTVVLIASSLMATVCWSSFFHAYWLSVIPSHSFLASADSGFLQHYYLEIVLVNVILSLYDSSTAQGTHKHSFLKTLALHFHNILTPLPALSP